MSSILEYKVRIDNFRILDIEDEIIVDGKISYEKCLELDGEKIIINISLQLEEEREKIYTIKLTSEKELCLSEFQLLVDEITKDLLNKIAFFYEGAKVGEPWLSVAKCKDTNMGTSELPIMACIDNKNRDKELLKSLCTELKKDNSFNKDDYNLFRTAMNNDDIVVKYMFLYQILLMRHLKSNGEESQKCVDNFIKSQFSKDKHMYQKWEDSNRCETIYTRLRNQVGHYRKKTPSETRNAMEEKIDELIQLIKITIDCNN